MRTGSLAVLSALALTLPACGDNADEPETVEVAVDDAAAAPAAPAASAALPTPTDAGATPMEERVATLGLLNKRNNVTEDITLSPGETREIGPVIISLAACERTAPWELPQETGAFVQVDVLDRGQNQHRRIFSGWLFGESPSLNVVEHPIYDIWVKDCTMSFPGDE